MFDLQRELQKLPDRPGVYLMHDADDKVIYVGKAVVLKNRVRQYFQAGYKRSPKIERMVAQIARFEYIITDSEAEALILECNLIKEYHPKYNTLLTDDKAYPFIRLSVQEDFPRISYSHRSGRDGARYFGPYISGLAVRDTIKLCQRLFRLRTCTRRLPEDIGSGRPCLSSQIGLCTAPCAGSCSAEEYKKQVDEAVSFLEGKYSAVEKRLRRQMKEAADAMDYETAASLRDLITSISHLSDVQKVTEEGDTNKDILASARDGQDAIIQVFFIRGSKLIGRDHFHMHIAEGDDDSQIMSDFIKQFYAGTPFIPHEIYLGKEPADSLELESALSAKAGYKVALHVPQRGSMKNLLRLATENAAILLRQNKEKADRLESRTEGAAKDLAAMLNLPSAYRMEAYDISNISGLASVGSMVVFVEGKPKKNDYRKFRIKTVTGANDYASLAEVLERRFTHGMAEREGIQGQTSFCDFPDIIMMDGGKGQVGIALSVLEKLGLDIPVCGMVKDDNHRTRGLYYQGEELPIDTKSDVFHLITRIQDEAHRFAIEYHRSLRGKNQVHSILDDIPGIGPARRKALMNSLGSRDAISSASVDELAAIPGMNRPSARMVYAFFHDGEAPD